MSAPTLDCGSCSMCCFLMSVPDIHKPACLHCEHEARPHGGCMVYDQPDVKPQACTDFKCLWLASQTRRRDERMLPHLRPDRVRVMFHDARLADDPNVMYVHVDPMQPSAWRDPDIMAHIDMVLARGCKVEVIIGYRRITLELGKPPVSSDDGAAARTALRRVA